MLSKNEVIESLQKALIDAQERAERAEALLDYYRGKAEGQGDADE